MSSNAERALFVARRLAESVSGRDLDATLTGLTRAAVETLPGVDHASITIMQSGDPPHSVALTDRFLEALDDWQFRQQEGPCYDGVRPNAFSVCADTRSDARYPRYGPRAAASGVRSRAGVRILESERSIAALNLYSRSVGALADIGFLAELFTTHAQVAISHAKEIEGLRDAMVSRQQIGQAVGIVMERFGLSDERAFAFLARLSNERNVKLRVVAQELIVDAQRP